MTVLEVIQRSAEFLGKKGVDSPRLQTELLLGHMLKVPRMQLYLNFERPLSPAELESFRELIRRRGQREPLQQITGSTCFCGVELAVNREVLVPRPETELLAERAWQFLGQLPQRGSTLSNGAQPAAALDFGTGSGCLALALAVKCPAAEIYALDISASALETARQNATRNGVLDRIRFFQGDGFAVLPHNLRFDLVVSNPPYIASGEIAHLQPEVRDFEPRQALDGGPDGLDCYRRLAAETAAWLRPGGKLMLEFGDGQSEALRKLFTDQNWIVESIIEDYTQRPRTLIASVKTTAPETTDPAAESNRRG